MVNQYDDITAMMGGVKTPEEQRMAQALRARQQTGDTLALSTIGQASNLGNQIGNRTSEAAGFAGRYKQAGLERDARASENALEREHTSTEKGLDRDQQTSESALNRAQQTLMQSNAQAWQSSEQVKAQIHDLVKQQNHIEAAKLAAEQANVWDMAARMAARGENALNREHAEAMQIMALEFKELQADLTRESQEEGRQLANAQARMNLRDNIKIRNEGGLFIDSADEDLSDVNTWFGR